MTSPAACPSCESPFHGHPCPRSIPLGMSVDHLTREHFGQWIDVPSRQAGGYLYVIRDEFHDGYPSRYLVLVGENGGAVEEEFTDHNPAGYPKTMGTSCVIRDERPAAVVGQQVLV